MSKIEIKNVEVLEALINRLWDPMLLEIILWVAGEYGLCFTEGWREGKRIGDVHDTDPLRAVDLRSWFYKPDLARFIEGVINRKWEYDHSRPDMVCAKIHMVDGGALHFHIQVHPNTRRLP